MSETAATAYGERPDEELVRLASSGDWSAFRTLYERYFGALYDFAFRTSRNREAAADVVQSTFTKAWERLQGGWMPESLRAWLYTVARNAAIDEMRRAGREVASGDGGVGDDSPPGALATLEAGRGFDPVEASRDAELVALVWESAEALGPRDYALLDMHVRRGLSADELAGELGMRKGAVYTALSRLRDSFEESVVTLLMMRRGRRECARLAALLEELRAQEPTVEVRRAVQAHIKECETCEATRRGLVAPERLLAGFALVRAPKGLFDRIWSEVAPRGGAVPTRRRRRAAAVALTVVVTGAGTAVGGVLDRAPRPPKDPVPRSTSHTREPSRNPHVVVTWARQQGVAGYSILWTRNPRELPDLVRDLPGTARGVERDLPAGRWTVVGRTEGTNGIWTSTFRAGPFDILPPVVQAACVPMEVNFSDWEGLGLRARLEGADLDVTLSAKGAAAALVEDLARVRFRLGVWVQDRLVDEVRVGDRMRLRRTLQTPLASGSYDIAVRAGTHEIGTCPLNVPAPAPEPPRGVQAGPTPPSPSEFPLGAAVGGGIGLLSSAAVAIVTRRRPLVVMPPTVECPDCRGAGTTEEACPECGGSNFCSECEGRGSSWGQPCRSCGGSRLGCRTCRGARTVRRPCTKCRGRGRLELEWHEREYWRKGPTA